MATDVRENQTEEVGTERTRSGVVFRPRVDILEGKDELTLLVDLPGATDESIDIHFEDGVLTIEGKVPPRYAEDTRFLWNEYGIGDFHRTFRVSEQVDSSRIQAEFADGVLTLHLPKAEAAKPRKIEVRSTAG